jgi:methionyl-tRNA synthetase
VFGALIEPIMPFTSQRLLDALDVPAGQRGWPERFDPDLLAPGHAIAVPEVLFGKLSNDQIEAWRERFGGVPV